MTRTRHIKTFQDFLSNSVFESDDYQGDHTAPDKDSGAPLYDLTINDVYPIDIYSQQAIKYYGSGETFDNEAINIIQLAHNKPNTNVTVYRAVPDVDSDNKISLKNYKDLIRYHDHYGFFPMPDKDPVGSDIYNSLRLKYEQKNYSYSNIQQNVYNELIIKIQELEKTLTTKSIINDGDWVTICRAYAKEHGDSNLNRKYLILTKKVKARNIYTDGNSIQEWGYWS